MALPSGSGSEILTSTYVHNQSDDPTAFRWDGTPATTGTETYTVPTNHIITVLGITVQEMGNAAESFQLKVNDGSVDIYVLYEQAIPAYGTFVFSEKLVIKSAHKLIVSATSGNLDFYCSYIDQDWS